MITRSEDEVRGDAVYGNESLDGPGIEDGKNGPGRNRWQKKWGYRGIEWGWMGMER
jgi:hypothetical protein